MATALWEEDESRPCRGSPWTEDATGEPSHYFRNITVRRKNVTAQTETGVLPRRLPGVLFAYVFGPEHYHFGNRHRPAGGGVAGATVTVNNNATGATRAVTTTADGFYQIPQLAPGTYALRAEAAGFKAVVRNDVQALVNTPLTLNLTTCRGRREAIRCSSGRTSA